jgi:hypothetical protein
MDMNAFSWLELIVLASLSGAAGQCARVIVGIKKLNDQASATNQNVADLIDPSRLFISLLIGAVAGFLAALVMHPGVDHVTPPIILAFAGAGYTGADFIEGIMSKYQPQPPAAPVG